MYVCSVIEANFPSTRHTEFVSLIGNHGEGIKDRNNIRAYNTEARVSTDRGLACFDRKMLTRSIVEMPILKLR